MTTIRRFCCNDLLRFASVNLEHLNETCTMSTYLNYLARWPDYFRVAGGPGNRIIGYVMGNVECKQDFWEGHVAAVFLGPEYCHQDQDLMRKMMILLVDISDEK